MRMRLAVPDLVSNSYFPAVAAVTLGALNERAQSSVAVGGKTYAGRSLDRGSVWVRAGLGLPPCSACIFMIINNSWLSQYLIIKKRDAEDALPRASRQ